MIQRSKLGLKFFSPAFPTPCLSSGPVNRSDAWHITVALPAQKGCAQTISANVLKSGSGRVFSGFGIWLKYGAGIGKTINLLTGSGIWLFPGKQAWPKIGHGVRDFCLRVCRECRKPSRPIGSCGQSKSTRRPLIGVSFQTKHPMECLVNRS